MIRFHVTARTGTAVYSYDAITHSSADAILDAIDQFGICSVTARPA